MPQKIVLLSSDTPHHRYFLNRLLKEGVPIERVYFETRHVEPPFAIGPTFEEEEAAHEEEHFFAAIERELSHDDLREVGTVNDPDVVADLQALGPDFGIIFGTGLVKPEVLEQFGDGLINVHRGIAQEYRGLDSLLWAIYHRDWDNLGVTIHRVDPQLDTGDVVYQQRLELRPDMRIEHLRYETTLMSTDLVLRACRDWQAGKREAKPQAQRGRYYSFMPLELRRLCQNRFNCYCEAL